MDRNHCTSPRAGWRPLALPWLGAAAALLLGLGAACARPDKEIEPPAGAAGSPVGDGGSGSGTGGRGGAAGDDGGEARAWCKEAHCGICTPDCCSITLEELPLYDPIAERQYCPPGTREFEQCSPADCACDPAERGACMPHCCGDIHVTTVCVDGAWLCPHGYQAEADCSALWENGGCGCETWWRLAGEVCNDAGEKVCALTPEVMEAACSEGTLCGTCEGFTGPMESEHCSCSCTDTNAVRCEPREAP